jgi:phosphopantothenoylcysteine synthetase/decarboxylase
MKARKLLLCATGGYQCYALPGFVLALLRHVAEDVQVVLSAPAAKLVSAYAVEVASRHPVYVEMSDTGPDVFVPHIELARAADVILVYPATVSMVGKVANGIADELISALIFAASAPVIFVPIANPTMWGQPAVRRNLDRLRADGYTVLPPQPGLEVATREGLEAIPDAFPHPTLLTHIRAALAGRAPGGGGLRDS